MDRIAAQIVNRQHVTASNKDALRALRNGMAKNLRSAPEWRTNRRIVYIDALKLHAQNKELYRSVVSGRI